MKKDITFFGNFNSYVIHAKIISCSNVITTNIQKALIAYLCEDQTH